jgi:hypothetical protein
MPRSRRTQSIQPSVLPTKCCLHHNCSRSCGSFQTFQEDQNEVHRILKRNSIEDLTGRQQALAPLTGGTPGCRWEHRSRLFGQVLLASLVADFAKGPGGNGCQKIFHLHRKRGFGKSANTAPNTSRPHTVGARAPQPPPHLAAPIRLLGRERHGRGRRLGWCTWDWACQLGTLFFRWHTIRSTKSSHVRASGARCGGKAETPPHRSPTRGSTATSFPSRCLPPRQRWCRASCHPLRALQHLSRRCCEWR